MLRSDKPGVTSIIRDLALSPGCYDSILHFQGILLVVRGESKTLILCCQAICSPLQRRRLPCPSRRRCEAIQRRTPYAKGEEAVPGIREFHKTRIHPRAYVRRPGILSGSVRNWACIPLSIRLHDGIQAARDGKAHLFQQPPTWSRWWRVLIMLLLLLETPCSCWTGISLLCRLLKSLNDSGDVCMELITKA